jgi:hypothetical protein
MNHATSFPLLSHRYKVVGLSIALAATAILALQKVTGNLYIQRFPEDRQSQLLFLLISFGLYIIAFSRELIDDAKVRLFRSKSIQAAFVLILSTMIASSFVSILRRLPSSQNDLPLVVFIGIVFYLSLFNFKIYFNKQSFF